MTEPPVARTGVGRHSAATVDDAAQRDAPPPPPVLAAAQVPAVPRSGQQHRRRVRDRLARRIVTGTQRSSTVRPVLEPLLAIHRGAHPKIDARLLQRGYDLAEERHRGQRRKSGDPYITHPLAVATILAELGMDTITLVAALLHDTVEDTGLTVEEVAAEFGPEVAHLVDGVTKLDKVKFGEAAEAETDKNRTRHCGLLPSKICAAANDRPYRQRSGLHLIPPLHH